MRHRCCNAHDINIVRSAVGALALGGMLAGAANLPAQASTTSTRTIMYGAAAAAAAFTLYNVEHKHQLATTVQGYLPNGGVVYADGHVALNGQTWYPGNSGQTVACNGQYCTINGNGNNGGYGYNNGGYGYSSAVRQTGKPLWKRCSEAAAAQRKQRRQLSRALAPA